MLDGLPNISKKLIFRSMVDMSVVMKALQWLKKTNFLYGNVYLDPQFLQMPDICLPEMFRDLLLVPDIKDSVKESTIEDTIEQLVERETCDLEDNDTTMDTNGDGAHCGASLTIVQKSSALETNSTLSSKEQELEQSSSRDASSKSVPASSEAVKSALNSLAFPIPYAVPYRSILVDQLKDRGSLLMHVPEGDTLEQYSVVDMSPMMPNRPSLELFAMKPVSGVPLKWEDPYVDVASFPVLFPDGRNGLFEQRGRRVTPAFYIEHRMRMADPRFRRDIPYVFDCATRKDMMTIHGSIYHMLNTGAFGKITAKASLNGTRNVKQSKTLEDNVHALLGSIVGTVQYWMKVRRDVEAVIEEYGPATFFLTFSCAEYHNEDFADFLIFRNFDVPNVRNVPTRNLASIDPVSVSLHFDNRFNAFWKEVILAEDGPLGCAEIFYIKKEYQQRGAPHMHVLLWIYKDAPKIYKDEDEAVLSFISQRITCNFPDLIESPTLHNLVTTFQMHNCTTTCSRYSRLKKGFGRKVCRFGFPRPVMKKCILNNLEDVLASRVSGSRRLQLYTLVRSIHEVMINDYNPVLLYLWKSNMDIQYVGHDNPAITYYTTAYMSKCETQKTSEGAQSLNASLSKAGMMKQFCCKMLKSRELGAYEAADKVLRNPMYRLSVDVKSAAFYRPSELRRKLLPLGKLKNLPSESTDVFCRNFQCSYYPNRPDGMDDMAAYDVLRWYEVKPGKSKKISSFYIAKYQCSFVKRTNPAVVKLWKSTSETSEVYERYCFQLVALFKPWRTIDDLLKDFDGNVRSSYADVFNAVKDTLPDMQNFASAKDRLAKHIEWAEKIKQSAIEQAENDAIDEAAMRERLKVVDVDLTLEADLCIHGDTARKQLTTEQVNAEYETLNDGQRQAFDDIVKRVAAQHSRFSEDGCAVTTSQDDLAPLFLYVSGVGGTGKSHLIRCIRNYIDMKYSKQDEPSVLVAAPTGIAAMNIDGITIHKLLKLPIQKSETTHQLYFSLAPDDLKMLRRLFCNVRLLIIDEISMLSNMYLLFVYNRLNEILIDLDECPDALFGNINVLLLGDLLQLPPVNAPYVFAPEGSADVSKTFGSIGAECKLWPLFNFIELTENMRQGDDLLYASLLDRVRIGSPTDDDIRLLQSRLIVADSEADEADWDSLLRRSVTRYLELMEENPAILCLMPLNEDVSKFNLQVMNLLKLAVIESAAEDTLENVNKGPAAKKMTKENLNAKPAQKVKRKLKASETGGFEEMLHLAVGVRVMLRRNMDPKRQLVNGSIGAVRAIDRNPHTGTPEVIRVAFDWLQEVVLIKKLTTKFMIGNGLFMTRVQFPVTLAYAITIHKCQRLSLDSAMIDVGPSTFTDSMCYVALSRVKKLSSLYLIRFDPSIVKCDKRCVTEYNRLRTTANERLSSMGLPQFQ